MKTTFDTVEDAIDAIAAGDLVVVVDDDDRENEGDLIMAASKATPEKVGGLGPGLVKGSFPGPSPPVVGPSE